MIHMHAESHRMQPTACLMIAYSIKFLGSDFHIYIYILKFSIFACLQENSCELLKILACIVHSDGKLVWLLGFILVTVTLKVHFKT